MPLHRRFYGWDWQLCLESPSSKHRHMAARNVRSSGTLLDAIASHRKQRRSPRIKQHAPRPTRHPHAQDINIMAPQRRRGLAGLASWNKPARQAASAGRTVTYPGRGRARH